MKSVKTPTAATVEKDIRPYCSETIHAPCDEIRNTTDSRLIITALRFTKPLSLMANHGVLRKDFSKPEMPKDFNANKVLSILTTIRQPQAIHYYDVAYAHIHNIDSRFTPTHRFMKTLRGRASRHRIDQAARHRFIMRSLIEETVSTLGASNDLNADYETAHTLITAKQEPAIQSERPAANFRGLHPASH